MTATPGPSRSYTPGRRYSAFTLMELLTVVAIISLLMAILLPSLSGARDAAKNAKTKGLMKSIGDGLELFRGENDAELRGNYYPVSTAGDDPTVTGDNSAPGSEDLFGAQWLVRYLLGQDLRGYIPRRTVPASVLDPAAAAGSEQIGLNSKSWYEQDPPLNRAPLYLPLDPRQIKQPAQLEGCPLADPNSASLGRYTNPVIIDVWQMPILYYAANTRNSYAERADANIATYKGVQTNGTMIDYRGIYTYRDNALFTGLCTESGCDPLYQPWRFKGEEHLLFYPDAWTSTAPTASDWATDIKRDDYRYSFPYFVLNRDAYSASGEKSVLPYRKDSFLLLSPGKDGRFGTEDDVSNFK